MLFKFQREIFSYYVANFGYTLHLGSENLCISIKISTLKLNS